MTETRASHDSEWAAITSVAEKIGCTPETLRKWLRTYYEHARRRREPERRPQREKRDEKTSMKNAT